MKIIDNIQEENQPNIIPAICADMRNYHTIPTSIPLNLYIDNGMYPSRPFDSELLEQCIRDIKEKNYQIVMIHLLCPNDVLETYRYNYPYFNMIRSLGRVGLTIHYKTPKHAEDEDQLFRQIIHMHLELPEAVWYIENEHNIYGQMNFVKNLNEIGIESYMLLDTTHIQMDLHMAQYGKIPYEHSFIDAVQLFAKYIGAYHISASQGYEGLIAQTHGKPIRTEQDEEFYKELVRQLCRIQYPHRVILIPEIQEDDYSAEAGRQQGKRGYQIIQDVLAELRAN